jgi:hypothetical protein
MTTQTPETVAAPPDSGAGEEYDSAVQAASDFVRQLMAAQLDAPVHRIEVTLHGVRDLGVLFCAEQALTQFWREARAEPLACEQIWGSEISAGRRLAFVAFDVSGAVLARNGYPVAVSDPDGAL